MAREEKPKGRHRPENIEDRGDKPVNPPPKPPWAPKSTHAEGGNKHNK